MALNEQSRGPTHDRRPRPQKIKQPKRERPHNSEHQPKPSRPGYLKRRQQKEEAKARRRRRAAVREERDGRSGLRELIDEAVASSDDTSIYPLIQERASDDTVISTTILQREADRIRREKEGL